MRKIFGLIGLSIPVLAGTLAYADAPVVVAQNEPAPITPPAENDLANSPRAKADAEKLDDRKIVQITHVANAGEIEQAQLASKKGVDAGVRKLARTIAKDHAQAQRDAAHVAETEKLAPTESAISNQLKNGSTKTMAELNEKSGADFDRAYVKAQVKQHEEVLRIIDTQLVPSAKDVNVKALIQGIRPHIQMHLDVARSLEQKLEK